MRILTWVFLGLLTSSFALGQVAPEPPITLHCTPVSSCVNDTSSASCIRRFSIVLYAEQGEGKLILERIRPLRANGHFYRYQVLPDQTWIGTYDDSGADIGDASPTFTATHDISRCTDPRNTSCMISLRGQGLGASLRFHPENGSGKIDLTVNRRQEPIESNCVASRQ